MQLLAIVIDSFRDAKDRKIFWIMIIISVMIATSMACVGFNDQGVDVLFGTWTHATPEWSAGSEELAANVAAVAIEVIADNYLGWIGMVMALVATAAVFPSLMEHGHIDITASKPLARWQLFLGRYLGGMVFMLVQAVVFVGLTFLVMGVRWGCWTWSYFWLVPLIVLMFSYLFAFSALFGVWTRRSMTSLMLTMMAWFVLFSVQSTHALLEANPEWDKTGVWRRTAAGLHWVVPKTQDITVIAGKLVGAKSIVEVIPLEEAAETEREREEFRHAVEGQRNLVAELNPGASIGSSLAAELAIILLAVRLFSRRDF